MGSGNVVMTRTSGSMSMSEEQVLAYLEFLKSLTPEDWKRIRER
jgi:hypothetical protein